MSLLELLAGAAKPLPGPFHGFEGTLHDWGYLGVGGFLFLEDFGVPVPGETMLIAASIYAGAGHLNVVVVGVVGFLAAVLGDNVGYVIGRFGGRRFVERFGRYVFLSPRRLDRAEAFFGRFGGRIVVIARFVEGLRQLNGIIAGTIDMPWPKFLVCNALGAALWVSFWTTAGYVAGDHAETLLNDATYVAIAVALAAFVLLVRRFRHRRRSRAG